MCVHRLMCAEHLKRRDIGNSKLPAAVIGILRLTREENTLTLTQLRLQEALVEPKRLHIARPIADQCRQHGKAAPPRLLFRHRLNDTEHRCAFTGTQPGDRRCAALILVGTRVVGQEIVHRLNAKAHKRRRLLYADAAHLADAVREIHRASFP